jgi:hypothetical protein
MVSLLMGCRPALPPTNQQSGAYGDPKSTFRTYIEAVRNNDVQAAKKCFVIDDNNRSGALDVIAGFWVSTRRLNQLAEKKFGKDGIRAIKGWRSDDVTDQALDRTRKLLNNATVKINGNRTDLKINWEEGDGRGEPAFAVGDKRIPFQSVGKEWKMDANKMSGIKRGKDFFKPGTWGPMFRDQVAIMEEAISGMEKGKLTTAKELSQFIEEKIEAMKEKHGGLGKEDPVKVKKK